MGKKILNLKVFLSLGVLFIIALTFFIVKNSLFSYAAETSSDAIAVRVIPNPNFYSALRWYQEQGFTGSPRSITVDGYEAVQEGRSVYVAASNVVGTSLYMNIYLISYTQEAETATEEIFNQILAHWKFNANIAEEGVCSIKTDKNCILDSDCPIGEYCSSQKSKIIRDTKRITNLTEIGRRLEDYKAKKGHYPLLTTGTYVPGKTLSVWPSWSQTLSVELGFQLSIDPVNELGDCGNVKYSPATCWDEIGKSFAGNLNTPTFPPGSRLFFYSTTNNGLSAKFCSQMETQYSNIVSWNCQERSIVNNPPVITGAGLFGWPKSEFVGYTSASDPDGDRLTWKINLVNPVSGDQWVNNYQWAWLSGKSGFSIEDTAIATNKRIRAAKAGLASTPGMYQINLVVDDGRGGVDSKTYDVTINGYNSELSNQSGTLIIGSSKILSLTGKDSSLNNISRVYFSSATFNDSPIATEALLNSQGLTISGMNLNVGVTPSQKTGIYKVNVYSLDPTTNARVDSYFTVTIGNNPPTIETIPPQSMAIGNPINSIQISSSDPDGHSLKYFVSTNPLGGNLVVSPSGLIMGMPQLATRNYDVTVEVFDQYSGQTLPPYEAKAVTHFSLDIINNPPIFEKIKAKYQNNFTEDCSLIDCRFAIDNGENATIQATAKDPDPNHAVTYSLTDTFGGNLTIDAGTGVISGFNKLNYHGIDDQEFPVEVKASDQYCNYSPAESCSVKKIIKVTVKKYCSVLTTSPGFVNVSHYISTKKYSLTSGATAAGTSLNLMRDLEFPAPDKCSTIGNGKVDVGAWGAKRNKSIVFVVDTSGSMDGLGLSDPAPVPSPMDKAKQAIIDVLGSLNARARTLPAGTYINVGLVRFSDNISTVGLSSIANISHYSNLVNTINTFVPQGGTNTLAALNQAELMLASLTEDKIVVLISDGVPGITRISGCSCWCYNPSCVCGIQFDCSCWPCTYDGGGSTGGSSYNTESDFKISVTTQTQCLNSPYCQSESCTGECGNGCSGCTAGSCSYGYEYDCDISSDTAREASALKAIGVELYTIFYDTGGASNEAAMASWSSGAGYYFSGADVSSLFSQVVRNILSSPINIAVNGRLYPPLSNDPNILNKSINDWTGINPLFSCSDQNVPLYVTFTNTGLITLENFEFDYCAPLLHR